MTLPTSIDPNEARRERTARLDEVLRERILVKDGATGTLLQAFELPVHLAKSAP